MTKTKISIGKYLKEEGFIDRSGVDIFSELSKLKGEDTKSWLIPILEKSHEGDNNQKEFYNAVAEVIGGIPVLERLKSRLYPGTKWFLNESIKLSCISRGSKVLDIGCATGLESVLFGEIAGTNGEVVGIDIAEKTLDIARARAKRRNLNNIQFLISNRNEIPFPENYFDNIFCFCSLNEGETEHDYDFFYRLGCHDRLKEFKRVLKIGGKLCIAEPSKKDLSWYTMHNVKDAISAGGLDLKHVKTRHYTVKYDQYPYSFVVFLAEKNKQ